MNFAVFVAFGLALWVAIFICLMEEGELEYLKGNRTYLRSKTTRLFNQINSFLQGFDQKTCRNTIADLKDLRSKLEAIEASISKGLWKHVTNPANLDAEFDKFHEYDDKVVSAMRNVEE